MASRQSKADLVAEVSALRIRLEKFEKSANKDPLTRTDWPGKAAPGEREEGPPPQNALAAIPHGVLQIDLLGNILYANPAYHKLFEYDDSELIGTSIIDRMESDESQKSMADILSKLRKDQPDYAVALKRLPGGTMDMVVLPLRRF